MCGLGPNPHPVKGTRGVARIDLHKKHSEDERTIWYSNVLQASEDTLSVEVIIIIYLCTIRNKIIY